MDILSTLYVPAAAVFCFMTLLFIIAVIAKDNSIADIAWGPGFIIASAAALVYNGVYGPLQIAAISLVAIWGLRLSVRIGRRNIGHGEDPRYKKWREEWGKFFLLRSYLQVFILQGAILVINVLPVLFIMSHRDGAPTLAAYIGLAVWVLGFIFEALGDYQLDRFLSVPANRGTIIGTGLWRYTRHPNYFGEATMWWGIFVMALAVPGAWIAFIGPLTITLMLLFVSGVPMTERMMQDIPGFSEYRRRTSVFVPWFPKKG